jgi:HJR/Mrr/RecB family endonuclease
MNFRSKRIPRKENSLEEKIGIGDIILIAINIIGGGLTHYLSIIEPTINEKIKMQEEEEIRRKEEELNKRKNELKLAYQNEIKLLRQEAKKHLAWHKYHSMSNDLNHVDTMTGKEFELFVAVLYKHMGYEIKMISAGADQGVDLILIDKENNLYAVQAKRWNKTVGNSAVQEIIAGKKYYKCKYALVITNSNFSKSAIELAKSGSVKLINRRSLVELCCSYFPAKIPIFSIEEWNKVEATALQCLGEIDNSIIDKFIEKNKMLSIKKMKIEHEYDELICSQSNQLNVKSYFNTLISNEYVTSLPEVILTTHVLALSQNKLKAVELKNNHVKEIENPIVPPVIEEIGEAIIIKVDKRDIKTLKLMGEIKAVWSETKKGWIKSRKFKLEIEKIIRGESSIIQVDNNQPLIISTEKSVRSFEKVSKVESPTPLQQTTVETFGGKSILIKVDNRNEYMKKTIQDMGAMWIDTYKGFILPAANRAKVEYIVRNLQEK